MTDVADRARQAVCHQDACEGQQEQPQEELGDLERAAVRHAREDETPRYRNGSGALQGREAAAARRARRLRVEPVGELSVAQALNLGEPADTEKEARDRVIVGPAPPGLEVHPDRERGAIAEVAGQE